VIEENVLRGRVCAALHWCCALLEWAGNGWMWGAGEA